MEEAANAGANFAAQVRTLRLIFVLGGEDDLGHVSVDAAEGNAGFGHHAAENVAVEHTAGSDVGNLGFHSGDFSNGGDQCQAMCGACFPHEGTVDIEYESEHKG